MIGVTNVKIRWANGLSDRYMCQALRIGSRTQHHCCCALLLLLVLPSTGVTVYAAYCLLTAQDMSMCRHPVCKLHSILMGLQAKIQRDCSPQVLIHSRCNSCM